MIASPPPRRRAPAWLFWLLPLALSLGYLAALAIGPRVPEAAIARDHLWLQNVRFAGPFGVSLNDDSFYYVVDAEDTRKLFLPHAALQSRPLLCLVAHPLGGALARLPLPAPRAAALWFAELLPWYLAFLILNTAFVALAYGLYVRLLTRYAPAPPGPGEAGRSLAARAPTAALLGLLLVANEVTKAFFLAAHAQMLNLLAPVLAVLAFVAFRRPAAAFRDALTATLLAGLGMLAYGGFVVLGASILLAWAWRPGNHNPTPGRWWSRPGEGLALLAALVAPYAGWWGLVHGLTGGFYNREVEHWHQLVWMREALAVGPGRLAADLLANGLFFVAATLHHWRPLAVAVVVLGWLTWPRRGAVAAELRRARSMLAGCLAVAGLYLLLFSAVGYRVERLAMPVTVCGFIVVGLWARVLEPLLPGPHRRALLAAMLVFTVGQMAWMVAKDGPFS